jgi:hypothetical protein
VKLLEDVLRQHGLEAEASPLATSAAALASAELPQSRTWDMTAMLGELTSSTQSKGYAGTEGSAFYLSSPDGNETDMEDEERDKGGLAEFPTPWMKRAGDDWRGGMSGSLMSRCRAMLPSRQQSVEMFEHFWEATAWR